MFLKQKLNSSNNRPSGFDYMRITLASVVIMVHTYGVCVGHDELDRVVTGHYRPFFAIIVPMFFALSGFLVAGSLERSRTSLSFIGLRVLRIVPALLVDTVLSVLILGPLFTTLPLQQYFTDRAFWSYWLNIVGLVHFHLPGLFAANPWHSVVNQQLWTLPYELISYLLLSAMAAAGLARNRYVLLAAIAAIYIALSAYRGLYLEISQEVFLDGPLLLISFLFGVVTYFFRDVIPYSKVLLAVSAAGCIIGLSVPYGDYFVPPFIAYVTVYLGSANPRRSRLVSSGDYSYGLFIYGFGIQQAVASFGGVFLLWYVNFPLAFALTAAFAALSWWFVEKPALTLRSHLYAFENKVVALSAAIPLGMHLMRPPIALPLKRPPARVEV